MMNIVHITPEIYPFTKYTSVSEAVYTLATELAVDNNVYVFAPLYASIDIEKFNLVPNGLKTWVDASYTVYEYDIFEVEIDNVKYVFFKNDTLFSRIGIYGSGTFDYADNDLRYATFCQAAMNYIKYHDIPADVLHSHEWSTALIPVYKNVNYADMDCKTILTIHSSENIGVFSKFCLESINLPWSLYNINELEYFDGVCFLKGGVVHADYVTTVSPTFANELSKQESGLGLDWLFSKHSNKLGGVLKGINYSILDPENGETTVANFSVDDISGKEKCRQHICEKYGLNPELPVISHVSSFAPTKGVELILDALPDMAKMDANIILLGYNVNPANNTIVCTKNELYDNVRIMMEEETDALIDLFAATDIILAPSLYEPRGEQVMVGVRYGAIPVVRDTGGLADVVSEAVKSGVGFIFEDFKREAMYSALKDAVEIYNSNRREEAVKKLMSLEYSSKNTAKQYRKLYKEITEV